MRLNMDNCYIKVCDKFCGLPCPLGLDFFSPLPMRERKNPANTGMEWRGF